MDQGYFGLFYGLGLFWAVLWIRAIFGYSWIRAILGCFWDRQGGTRKNQMLRYLAP